VSIAHSGADYLAPDYGRWVPSYDFLKLYGAYQNLKIWYFGYMYHWHSGHAARYVDAADDAAASHVCEDDTIIAPSAALHVMLGLLVHSQAASRHQASKRSASDGVRPTLSAAGVAEANVVATIALGALQLPTQSIIIC
jgi:hypothetical protein